MVVIFRDKPELVGFDVLLYDVPGALSSVVKIFEKYKINITYFEYISMVGRKDVVCVFIVGDFTGVNISPKDVLNEIRRVKKYVNDACFSATMDGIICCNVGHLKIINEFRIMCIPEVEFCRLLEGALDKLGTELLSALMYQIGYSAGKYIYDYYSKRVRINNLEDCIKLLNMLLIGYSMGKIFEYKMLGDKLIVRVEGLMDYTKCIDNIISPSHHYIRGLISAFILKSSGREADIKEKKCITLRDKYCEFEITLK